MDESLQEKHADEGTTYSFTVKYKDLNSFDRRSKIRGATMTDLHKSLKNLFSGVNVFWKDSEGDNILILTPSDLDEALENSENMLKVMLEKKSSKKMLTETKTEFGSSDTDDVHSAICDNCDLWISGCRYKCIVCKDYDLCSVCFAKKVHVCHAMIAITDPRKTMIPASHKYREAVSALRSKEENIFEDAKHLLATVGSTVCESLTALGINTTYEIRHPKDEANVIETAEEAVPTSPAVSARPVAPKSQSIHSKSEKKKSNGSVEAKERATHSYPKEKKLADKDFKARCAEVEFYGKRMQEKKREELSPIPSYTVTYPTLEDIRNPRVFDVPPDFPFKYEVDPTGEFPYRLVSPEGRLINQSDEVDFESSDDDEPEVVITLPMMGGYDLVPGSVVTAAPYNIYETLKDVVDTVVQKEETTTQISPEPVEFSSQESIGSEVTIVDDEDSEGWDRVEVQPDQPISNYVSNAPALPASNVEVAAPQRVPTPEPAQIDSTQATYEDYYQISQNNVDEAFATLIGLGCTDQIARRAISHCGTDIQSCIAFIFDQY